MMDTGSNTSTASDPSVETPPLSRSRDNSDVLILDADTRTDLHLFGSDSETDTKSLFDFCNRAQTAGGQKALRRRMESPWSNAERIKDTQASLSFILRHHDAFAGLPSAYLTKNVERYFSVGMPIVRQHNLFEFTVAALALRINHDSFYTKIMQGTKLTCRLLLTLRELAHEVQTQTPGGELAPLIDEAQALLDRPRLSRIPGPRTPLGFWKILRLDQAFRLHERTTIARLLELCYEMDALVAMAEVTREHGFVLPQIEAGPVRLHATGLVHPLLEAAVANPLELNQDHRVLFLTGPNMAGKTTYLRTVATALYFAHLGMGVPAQTFHFVPVQHLLTSISPSDNLTNGVSYFRAEALRVKAVAQAVADGCRVVAIMDEPFKGTNIKDAFDASLAILERFATVEHCLFVVSSHLIELSERLSKTQHVIYRYFEAEEHSDRLRFDYVLHPGVSSQRLGMRVLREEGVFDLLDGIPDPET